MGRGILCLATLLFSSSAFALDVSGPIVSTTTWSAAQSPYRVTADVSVEGGATLIVEPGVTVFLQPGTNLRVNAGAVRAVGTSALPIVFTSASDTPGGSPVPGSWGVLRFGSATNDAFTVLEHVEVRYGQGVVIESASPTLNFVTLLNNSGPAISIDLNSSPTGVGLQASGNSVNGVAVAAGELTGSVLWGLQGIPYVVGQVVSVGRAPTIVSIAPSQIAQGQTVRMTVSGARLSGVESVRFDNAALTGALVPGGDDSSFALDVTASALAATGPSGIEAQVAAGKVRLDNAVTVIPPKPPIVVNNITPNSLRRGETKSVQATGTNLAGASVTTTATGLMISGVSTTATSVSFTLAASTTATLGDQTLVFTNPANASGSANATVTVIDLPPTVVTSPAPVAVPPDNVARLIKLRLSRADAIDHSFAASVTNTAVATVSPANVTIAAGQTETNLLITGKIAGQTVLTLVSPTLGTSTAPVFVTTEFSGLNTSFALPLGVVVTSDSTTPSSLIPLVSPALGIAVGNYISDVSPKVLTIGTGPVPLVISGAGLGAVTAVSISPNDGLTVGTPVASADGTSLTVPVTVAATAPTTIRQVIVLAGSSRYVAMVANQDRVKIVNVSPEIDSISPLFALRGTNAVGFNIAGRNFQDLQSVNFTPADGIAVGPVTVSGDSKQIVFSINVDANASIGSRVVTVTTLGGVTSTLASPANTFAIVNQIQQNITPIAALALGVVVEPTPQPPVLQGVNVGPAVLGVTFGSVITGMSPVAGEIGSNVTLTLQGSDLGAVTTVQLSPATGVTIGTPLIATDGKSLTVSIAIATDAPQTLRGVQVLAGSQRIAFALPSASLFRVTPPQPRIDSINPLFLQIGAPLTTLTVSGGNFQNASLVRVSPPDGLTITTPPTVNAGGTVATVNIAAAAGAAPGPRVVTVVTPAGETTNVPSIADTLTLTTNAGTNFGPFAASLGVVVQDGTPPPVSTSFGPFAAPNLGVVVTPAPQPVNTPQFVVGSSIGVTVGPYAQAITPAGVFGGQNATVTITGSNLDAVSGVSIAPSTGLTLGTVTVSADGKQLFVPVTADAAAPSGPRQFILTSAAGPVRFSNQAADVFTAVPAIPVISSIDPILGTQGQVVSLLIRATNLQYATGVTITPDTGVAFASSFTVDPTGTQLTIPFVIAPDALIGVRVIQVLTPAGATPADATPANTFTIRSP